MTISPASFPIFPPSRLPVYPSAPLFFTPSPRPPSLLFTTPKAYSPAPGLVVRTLRDYRDTIYSTTKVSAVAVHKQDNTPEGGKVYVHKGEFPRVKVVFQTRRVSSWFTRRPMTQRPKCSHHLFTASPRPLRPYTR